MHVSRTVGLEEKVRFLSDPGSYPSHPASVEVIETHMAWVFLAGGDAYKLKKPVRYELLDYRTLQDRSRVCREEVRLNRRLAPDVYLGVIGLAVEPGRRLAIGGEGRVIEWLVHMRRLPDDGMLDRALLRGPVSDERLDGAARLLARFYADARPVPMTNEAYRERFRASVDGTLSELLRPSFGLPRGLVTRLSEAQLDFLTGGSAAFLDHRAEEGRIVEGHGDLRPEHVFLGSDEGAGRSAPSTPSAPGRVPLSDPVIIDCLEFDRKLRLLDPVDELSFLAMECTLLGHPLVGERFRRVYAEETGDTPPPELLRFYESFRAFLRAKIAIWHLSDHGVPDHERWRNRALRYLEFGRERMPIV
jgi:uncharacterized protein